MMWPSSWASTATSAMGSFSCFWLIEMCGLAVGLWWYGPAAPDVGPEEKGTRPVSKVVGGDEKRNVNVGRIHLHTRRDTFENALQGEFGGVVGIRKVFRSREDDSSLEEALRAEESRKTEERAVHPSLLFGCDREFRFSEAKHAKVLTERLVDGQTPYHTSCAGTGVGVRDIEVGVKPPCAPPNSPQSDRSDENSGVPGWR